MATPEVKREYKVAEEAASAMLADWEYRAEVNLPIKPRAVLTRAIMYGRLNFDGENFTYDLVVPVDAGKAKLEKVIVKRPTGRAILDCDGASAQADIYKLVGILIDHPGIEDRFDLRDLNTLCEIAAFFDH